MRTQVDCQAIQRNNSFFVGRIIDENEQNRNFLQNTIENHVRQTIRKTSLLYRMDSLNKNNIHRYVDNHPNLMLLLKLENGWICGGYSESSFYPKMISDKDGIIFSVSAQECFQLKTQNKRAITYDDFFIIFGNSELRVKTQEGKLFSNFGINAAYYDPR